MKKCTKSLESTKTFENYGSELKAVQNAKEINRNCSKS